MGSTSRSSSAAERALAAAPLAHERRASRRCATSKLTPSTARTGRRARRAARRAPGSASSGPRTSSSGAVSRAARTGVVRAGGERGPGASRPSGGTLARSAVARSAAAVAEAAARGIAGRGTMPGIVGEARRPRVARATGSSPAGRACTGARAGEERRPPAPAPRSGPAYITTTASHISATTPRSWVISITAMPRSRLQSLEQVQDLGLDRDVERGGRLVGDQQARGRRRAPWRSSPAAACRPRAGAGTRPTRCSGAGMPTCRSISTRALARGAPRRAAGAAERLGDLLADREDRVERGHRLLEDHRDLGRRARGASRAPAARAGRGPRTAPAPETRPAAAAGGPSATARSGSCRNPTRRRWRACARP